MSIKSITNNFITSGIRSSDVEIITKFKTLNIFLCILILVSPCLGFFYFFIKADFLFYIVIGAGILGVSALILLRLTKSLMVAGNYAFFILWAAFLIIRWNTGAMSEGGLILLSWIWNAALILMAIFITGYQSGTIWGTLIFLETGVAVYLFKTGYEFPNLIPSAIAPIYSLGAYLSGLLVILFIAFMYEKEKDDALEREQLRSRTVAESKQYIDTLVEKSPLPTFVVDMEHRVIQWNRACQRMTGIPTEEIIGKKVPVPLHVDNQQSLADLVIEDPNSIIDRFSSSIVSKTESGFFEVGVPFPEIKDGMQANVTVAPILDINGVIKGAIEIIHDVTNAQEGHYSASDDQGQALVLQSNPVFKIDAKGKVSFWNKACEENFGYHPSKIIGNSPLTFVSKSTRKPFSETIVRVFKGESFNGKEWKYYSADGEPVHVLAKVYSVKSIDGKTKECVVENTDITDFALRMKELEQETIEAKDKLKKMNDEYALLRKNIATYIRKKAPGAFDSETAASEYNEDLNGLIKNGEDNQKK
jgi:PAS domain S-box-containing protein